MKNLKQKWIALLAVVCMLLAMVPLTAWMAVADSEPMFSQLLVQFIGRMPTVDAKSGLFVSLSNDGENWTEAVEHKGHGANMWGCANSTNVAGWEQFFGVIDVTEQAKALTGDKFFVKIGMAAGDVSWTVLHQVRVVGTYTGETAETEFFWDDYSNLPAYTKKGGAQDVTDATANLVSNVARIVAANNVYLQQCKVDHTATGLSPYHGGYYGEPDNANGYVVYELHRDGSLPDKPDQPPVVPAEGVYFEFLGRMPGDVNGANKVQVMVGSDGENWTEAALLEGIRDDHGDSTYFKVNITHAVDMTADNLYVKMNLISYLAEWCSARQMRLTHVDAEGVETTLMHVIYDDMAIRSQEYKSGMYVDSANMQLRGTYDPAANDPSGLTMNEDCDGQDGKALGDNYITYKIALKDTPDTPDQPDQPDDPVVPENGFILNTLTFEYLGRLPENGEGKNMVRVALSTDGENWTLIYVQNPFKDGSNPAWIGGQYSGVVDLTEAAKDFIGKEIPALYARFSFNAGITNWCAVEAIRLTGKVNGGESVDLLYAEYDRMTASSLDYRDAKYVDSDMIRLTNIAYDGAYLGRYPSALGKVVVMTPVDPYDPTSGKDDRCYITYKILGDVDPDEVTPAPEPDDPNVGGGDAEVIGNETNLGYFVNFNTMENGATEWHSSVYDIYAMKVFYDSGDSYTMLCPDASKNPMGAGYVTYKVVAPEGQTLGLVGLTMNGRVFDLDADDSRGLTVEYSLDDGTTWVVAKHYASTTTGRKDQGYSAALGIIDQQSVLVRITMSSGMNDWVGLTDLKIHVPNSIAVGFYENFDAMLPGSKKWQNNIFSFNMMTIYSSDEGYNTLTTNQNVTDKGLGFVEYLITAEEGKTLDGLQAIITGRIYDFNNDANRGLTITCSDDYGRTYYAGARIAAGEASGYDQEFFMDLSAAAAGKTSLLVRIEVNTGFWDWVGMQSIEFISDDYTPPADDDDDDWDDDWDDADDDDDDWDDNWDDNQDDDDVENEDPSPETGDTLPYVAMILMASAVAFAFVLRKKQTN